MAEKEKPLAEFPGVRHKKQDGVLLITSARVAWSQGDVLHSFQLNYPYQQIKAQRISPETSSKIQLQLVLRASGSQVNFHFTGPDALTERNKAKILLQQLLAKFSVEVRPELKIKTDLLNTRPELYQLYKDLVVSGLISADEFWVNRLDKEQGVGGVSDQQETGLPSAFLADVHAVSDGCNAVKFNLTPDVQQAIFKTYPSVKSKHADLVPDKMTEEEFWKQFFQSQFFHKEAGSRRSFFSDCLSREQKSLLESNDVTSVPLNTTETAKHHLGEAGYSLYPDNTTPTGHTPQSSVPLLQRCNLHSSMVLKALQTNSDGGGTTSQGQVQDTGSEDMVTMRLKPSQFSKDRVVPGSSVGAVMTELAQWSGHHSIDLTSSSSAVTHLMPGGVLMPTSGCGQVSLSCEQKDLVFRHTSAVAELLRHFWSCFPVRTAQLEEKVHRMYRCLQDYYDSKFDDLVISLGHSDEHRVVDHMKGTVRLALDQYHSWLARRNSISGK